MNGIKRREFLTGCGAAAVSGVSFLGCGKPNSSEAPASKGPEQRAATPPPPSASPGDSTAKPLVQLDVRGLGLLVLPEAGNAWAEVAFVDATFKKGSAILPHVPSLIVPREAIQWTGHEPPAMACDDQWASFSLADSCMVFPRASVDSSELRKDPSGASLEVGMAPISDPTDCKAANWNSVEWMLSLKRDLWPPAELDGSRWRRSKALLGRIRMDFGHLESGPVAEDRDARFSYTLPDQTKRIVKERVRYALDAPFVQFVFGKKGSLLINRGTKGATLRIRHLSAAHTMKERMTDLAAVYQLLTNANGVPASAPIPSGRTLCGASMIATGTSEACPNLIIRQVGL